MINSRRPLLAGVLLVVVGELLGGLPGEGVLIRIVRMPADLGGEPDDSRAYGVGRFGEVEGLAHGAHLGGSPAGWPASRSW